MAFVVRVMGKYLSDPGLQHWKVAKHMMSLLEENKEISEKGRQGSSRNVEEETTRS